MTRFISLLAFSVAISSPETYPKTFVPEMWLLSLTHSHLRFNLCIFQIPILPYGGKDKLRSRNLFNHLKQMKLFKNYSHKCIYMISLEKYEIFKSSKF